MGVFIGVIQIVSVRTVTHEMRGRLVCWRQMSVWCKNGTNFKKIFVTIMLEKLLEKKEKQRNLFIEFIKKNLCVA